MIEPLVQAGADPLGGEWPEIGFLVAAIDVAIGYGGHQSLAWLLDYTLARGGNIDDYLAQPHHAARQAREGVLREFFDRVAD